MIPRRYYKYAVEQGIKQLDRVRPGWRTRITSPILPQDLSSIDRCILGRVFGNYSVGMEALALHSMLEHAPAFGFAPGHTPFGDLVAYTALANEWNLALEL